VSTDVDESCGRGGGHALNSTIRRTIASYAFTLQRENVKNWIPDATGQFIQLTNSGAMV
jgi:2-polyprenyl-3-methyl-5-hydroxy-6-metoxy-1,4-benzoquinol methylase